MKRIFLHIGLPKTGTTTFQYALGQNRTAIRRQGADYFVGKEGFGFNHSELYLCSLRPGVDTFAHIKWKKYGAPLIPETKSRLEVFINRSRRDSHIFSAGGLSFLRSGSEIDTLRSLFPVDVNFKIIFVERDKDDWLKSWTKQITSKPGRELSLNPNSTMYVGPDTWLTDFEQLKDVWQSHFDDFTCIPYRKEGLIEEICDEIGIKLPPSALTTRYKERGQARQAPSRVERAWQKVRRLANRADYWMRYDRHL